MANRLKFESFFVFIFCVKIKQEINLKVEATRGVKKGGKHKN